MAQTDVVDERATGPRDGTTYRLALLILCGAALWTGLFCAAFVVTHRHGGRYIADWPSTQYWVTYQFGFVRRGLPGELLRLVAGDSPGATAITVAGVLVSAVGMLAIAALAAKAARQASNRAARLGVWAVIVSSPFTFSLLTRDLGRYDALGAVAAFLLTRVRWDGPPRRLWAPAAATAAVLAVAAATQEFLPLLLVSLVALAVWQADGPTSLPLRATFAAASLLPALVIAGASALTAPSPKLLDQALASASSAGVDVSQRNAITTLTASLHEQVAYVAERGPVTVAVWIVAMAGFYVAASGLLWRLTGRPVRRTATVVGLYLGAAALVLSVVGVDFRRWFALAFVAFLAALVMINARKSPTDEGTPELTVFWLSLGVFVGLCLLAQFLPYYPIARANLGLP